MDKIQLDLNQTIQIKVDSYSECNNSGILMNTNESYRFEVNPPGQEWWDGKFLGSFTAEGRNTAWMYFAVPVVRMPSAKWFSLLGSIDDKRSTYFKIGTYKEDYTPPSNGELVCFTNDVRRFYEHNNTGIISLTITRIK